MEHAGRVYLDHAATTPLESRVLDAMLPYLRDVWGNPSSIYLEGREARKALEAARRSVAECLGARPSDIVFTSGGRGSDNRGSRGSARAAAPRGRLATRAPPDPPPSPPTPCSPRARSTSTSTVLASTCFRLRRTSSTG